MKKEQPFPTTCQAEEAELLTDDGQVEECSGFPNAKSIYLAIKQTNKNKRSVSGAQADTHRKCTRKCQVEDAARWKNS